MLEISKLLTDGMQLVMAAGIVVYAWCRKWQDTHPRKIGELTETDAVITYVQYQWELLRPREQQRAKIGVQYINEAGKKVGAELSTVPIRHQLESLAPELKTGEKVRICYEKCRPHIFYFADPRYAAPEVSGVPKRIRLGWFGLVVVTLLMILLIAFNIFLTWMELHK